MSLVSPLYAALSRFPPDAGQRITKRLTDVFLPAESESTLIGLLLIERVFHALSIDEGREMKNLLSGSI